MTDVLPDPGANKAIGIDIGSQQNLAVPSVRKSLFLSFAERYVAFAVQIVTTAILARLLTPADYGVFTVAAVIVSITQSLRDFGAMGFIIQERELTEARVRTVYGVSLLIGGVLGVVVALASGEIAAFYNDDSVRSVLLVLSVNFVLLPYGSLIVVLWRREMKFDAILRINIVGAVATAMISITLAVAGLHAISLAWGSLGGTAATAIMGMLMRKGRSYRLLPSLKEWRRIVSFGTVATAAVVISSIGQEAPDLLIGRFLGVEALGIYGRASGLVAAFNRLVSSGVAPVAVSALASRHRAGAAIREEFIAGTVMITAVAWPFFCFLALMAFPVTRILFGEGWDAAVPIARILSLAGAVSALGNLNQLTLQAKGAPKNSLRIHALVQPIMIAAVTLAAQLDLWAVAGAFIFGNAMFVAVSYHHLERLIGVSLLDVLQAVKTNVIVTAASALGPALVLLFMPDASRLVWISFIVASAGAGLGWLAGIALVRHPLLVEIKAAAIAMRQWLSVRHRATERR
jgi:O-antigen/teichoic acid export membrane protein